MKIQLNFEDNKLSHIGLRKAKAAYSVAERAMDVRRKPLLDHVCIWSEQATAWFLMAFLAKRSKRYSIDENVMGLIKKAMRVDSAFKQLFGYCNALNGMSRFAYPPYWATKEDANNALSCASIVRKFSREKLGLAKPRAKKRR